MYEYNKYYALTYEQYGFKYVLFPQLHIFA